MSLLEVLEKSLNFTQTCPYEPWLVFLLQKEITVDDHDMDHMTGNWSILIGQKKEPLEEGLLPFSFCSKVVYTLVDVLQIPPQMKGKYTTFYLLTDFFMHVDRISTKLPI